MLLEQMNGFSLLDDHQYVALTTFRSDGLPITTPFPFALVEDKVYVMAAAGAGEIQRIHENAQVEVAPCTADGISLAIAQEGMALALAPEPARIACRALRHKFGLRARLQELALGFRRESCVYLEITPM